MNANQFVINVYLLEFFLFLSYFVRSFLAFQPIMQCHLLNFLRLVQSTSQSGSKSGVTFVSFHFLITNICGRREKGKIEKCYATRDRKILIYAVC